MAWRRRSGNANCKLTTSYALLSICVYYCFFYFRTAKKQKEKTDQRAIEEKKRLTVAKMQKKARDKRARDRGKLSKERQVSGYSSPRTRRIEEMVARESITSCSLVPPSLACIPALLWRTLTVMV
jgi:hypothetical protein